MGVKLTNTLFECRETGRYAPVGKDFAPAGVFMGKCIFVRDGVEKCQFMSMNVIPVVSLLRSSNVWRMRH
jgi:hypothetical protein